MEAAVDRLERRAVAPPAGLELVVAEGGQMGRLVEDRGVEVPVVAAVVAQAQDPLVVVVVGGRDEGHRVVVGMEDHVADDQRPQVVGDELGEPLRSDRGRTPGRCRSRRRRASLAWTS